MVITVQCPSCETSFPVDTEKVPEEGVHARCSNCQGVFFVERPSEPADTGQLEGSDEEMVAVSAPAEVEAPEEPFMEAPSIEEESAEEESAEEESAALTAEEESFETPVAVETTEELPTFEPLAPEVEVETEAETVDAIETPLEVEVAPLALEEAPAVEEEEAPPLAEIAEETTPSDEGESGFVPVEEAPSTEGFAPPPAPEAPPAPPPSSFSFGRRDPHEKARRLARVLVSDMIMYNPERHTRALEMGSLKDDFEDEIKKSWEEYVEQVGDDIAGSTNYFNDALNDILAKGQSLFP